MEKKIKVIPMVLSIQVLDSERSIQRYTLLVVFRGERRTKFREGGLVKM